MQPEKATIKKSQITTRVQTNETFISVGVDNKTFVFGLPESIKDKVFNEKLDTALAPVFIFYKEMRDKKSGRYVQPELYADLETLRIVFVEDQEYDEFYSHYKDIMVCRVPAKYGPGRTFSLAIMLAKALNIPHFWQLPSSIGGWLEYRMEKVSSWPMVPSKAPRVLLHGQNIMSCELGFGSELSEEKIKFMVEKLLRRNLFNALCDLNELYDGKNTAVSTVVQELEELFPHRERVNTRMETIMKLLIQIINTNASAQEEQDLINQVAESLEKIKAQYNSKLDQVAHVAICEVRTKTSKDTDTVRRLNKGTYESHYISDTRKAVVLNNVTCMHGYYPVDDDMLLDLSFDCTDAEGETKRRYGFGDLKEYFEQLKYFMKSGFKAYRCAYVEKSDNKDVMYVDSHIFVEPTRKKRKTSSGIEDLEHSLSIDDNSMSCSPDTDSRKRKAPGGSAFSTFASIANKL
jgi:hypothetical protein